ncbi:MAG: hypothetical protein MUF00_09590 [Gemmatimonadaceae bacterium]|jgi:hypothetical protein|nr:hypothetical protein [Gemmatimonadaceae bacterium]
MFMRSNVIDTSVAREAGAVRSLRQQSVSYRVCHWALCASSLMTALAACAPVTPALGPNAATRAAMADSIVRAARRSEQQLATSPTATARVAVFPIGAPPGDSDLEPAAFALSDFLQADLAEVRGANAVERARLDAVLRELALVSAPETGSLREKGTLAGAEQVFTGALFRQSGASDRIGYVVRLVRTANGERTGGLDGATRFDLAGLLSEEKRIAFWLLDALGVEVTPAERQRIEQRPTRNLAALLAYGRGVREELRLNFSAAAREFARAVQADPSFMRAAVRQREAERATQAAARGVTGPRRARATTLSLEGIAAIGALQIPDAADGRFPRGPVFTTLQILLVVP